jgi:hypothetical protein
MEGAAGRIVSFADFMNPNVDEILFPGYEV